MPWEKRTAMGTSGKTVRGRRGSRAGGRESGTASLAAGDGGGRGGVRDRTAPTAPALGAAEAARLFANAGTAETVAGDQQYWLPAAAGGAGTDTPPAPPDPPLQ